MAKLLSPIPKHWDTLEVDVGNVAGGVKARFVPGALLECAGDVFWVVSFRDGVLELKRKIDGEEASPEEA